MGLASSREKFLYLLGMLCSIGSGTVLPLMTLIFGNTVTVFTGFAIGTIDGTQLREKINHYT
jgi:ATP-binding cassette subfamily B (MDR/TAP) protein 1